MGRCKDLKPICNTSNTEMHYALCNFKFCTVFVTYMKNHEAASQKQAKNNNSQHSSINRSEGVFSFTLSLCHENIEISENMWRAKEESPAEQKALIISVSMHLQLGQSCRGKHTPPSALTVHTHISYG